MAVLLWLCSRCILSARALVFLVLHPPGCPPPLPPPLANLTLLEPLSHQSTNGSVVPTPFPPEARFASRGRVPAAVLLRPMRIYVGGLGKSKKNTAGHARTNFVGIAAVPGAVFLISRYQGRK